MSAMKVSKIEELMQEVEIYRQAIQDAKDALIKGVDYKLPFVFSAVVNVVAFAAHFFVVNRKDKQVKDEDPD